jgi:hypothetical protein
MPTYEKVSANSKGTHTMQMTKLHEWNKKMLRIEFWRQKLMTPMSYYK